MTIRDMEAARRPDAPMRAGAEELQAFFEALRSNDPGAEAMAEELLERFPKSRGVRGKLARIKLAAGDNAGALAVLQQELARVPGQPKLLKMAATAAEALHGREAALPLLQALADTGQDGGWAQYRLGEYATETGDGAEAFRRFELAERLGFAPPSMAAKRFRAAIMARNAPLARQLLAELPPELQARMEPRLRSLEARAPAIAAMRKRGRLHALTSNQLKAWGAEQGAAAFGEGEPELFVTESGDLLGHRVPGARSAVLVFGGLKDMTGVALPKFDQLLRTHGVSTLYLSDPRRLLLLSGLETFGDYHESLEGLSRLLGRWDVERTYCLGFSAGGFPAIAYGLELKAHRILTFAAPTSLEAPVVEADGRARILLGRIRSAVAGRSLDLRKAIEAMPDPPPIINYYGADCGPDVVQAENLRGLANVDLRRLDGEIGHAVVHHLQHAGRYEAVIDELLADKLPPRA